jgi:hypothetical protein
MSELIEHLGAVREIPPLPPQHSLVNDSTSRAQVNVVDDLGRILLLGEDNPQSSDPSFQLYPRPIGCAGHRLQTMILGLHSESDYLAIWRTNLCSPSWDSGRARKRARMLLSDSVPWSVIVMLGRKVARAFDDALITDTSLLPFVSCRISNRILIALPHPSGRCKDWNDPVAIHNAQKLMRTHCPTIRWGGALI